MPKKKRAPRQKKKKTTSDTLGEDMEVEPDNVGNGDNEPYAGGESFPEAENDESHIPA